MSSGPRPLQLTLAEGPVAALGFGDPGRPVDVIFLHATGFNARTYSQGLAAAGEHLHVVAIDQRGHGLSGLPADPDSLTEWTPFADDLLAFREALGISHPVVLAGHSMGGTVSVMATPRLGEAVKALVLFDPVFMRPPPGYEYRRSPLAAGALKRRRAFESKNAAKLAYDGRGAFKSWPHEAVADYIEDGFAPAPEGGVTLTCTPEWESAIFAGQAHDPWTALDLVTRPIHVLKAEHHSTCLIEQARIDDHAERRLEVVAGTTHFLPMERPDLVAAALIEACA